MPHQANRLHDVWAPDRHLIAKEYLGDLDRNGPANEYRALQVVQSLDIAPQPVFFDRSVGRVVLYEFLDGQMWDRRVPSAIDLQALADLWVDVQTLPTEGLWCGWPTVRGRDSTPLLRAYARRLNAMPRGRRVGMLRDAWRRRRVGTRWSLGWLMDCR